MRKPIGADVWVGRTDHAERRSSFRYHQIVERMELDTPWETFSPNTCAIIGFECEEGVRRNQGRLGAANAPNAIRQALASLPWRTAKDHHLVDAGNVVFPNANLKKPRKHLALPSLTSFPNPLLPLF